MKSNEKGLDNNPKKQKQYIEPIVTIGLSLIVWVCIMVTIHSIMGTEKEVTITYNSAEEYLYAGKLDEAIAEYTKMQNEDKWPIWTVRIAEIYSIQGEVAQSNNLLKEAIVKSDKLVSENKEKYEEQDKELINEVIFNFFINSELEQAESLGEYYLEMYSTYKPLLKTMFGVYIATDDLEAAKEVVDFYSVDNESSYDLAVLAQMQIILDNYDDGLNNLKKAWDLNNNEIKISDVIMETSEYNKTTLLDKINELSEENPKDKVYESWIELINSEGIGQHNVANDVLNEIDLTINENKLDEDSYVYSYINGWDNLIKGDLNKANEYAKKTIVENNMYGKVYGVLMPQIMIAEEKTENIEIYFRKAIQAEPYNYSLISSIAQTYSELSNYSKAKEYYSLAISLDENEGDLYYKSAFVDIDSGKYDAAVEILKSIIKDEPENGKLYRTLGTVYYQLGQKDLAIENIRKAYSLDESDILALNNAACYYIMEDKDVWRGYTNIEAAYNEIDDNLDSESKEIIESNYKAVKKVYDVYVNDENANLLMPTLQLMY